MLRTSVPLIDASGRRSYSDIMTTRQWIFDPEHGGTTIPAEKRVLVAERIEKYAQKHYAGKFTNLNIRFRGALCYIDAYTAPPQLLDKRATKAEQRLVPTGPPELIHLCRLRHFSLDRWSLAFFSYSDERYHSCAFNDGKIFGTPEGAFDVGAVYLE